jgi:SAM-dependent methyltransferase
MTTPSELERKTSPEFFEAMYRRDADPWNFAGSEYEGRRYSATLAALEGRRYRRVFEPGCSVGVLTERLAGIADAVEACDVSETAVAEARRRCEHLANVDIWRGSLSERLDVPECDLVVLSEIGYYFEAEVWTEMVEQLVGSMNAGAVLLAVHWLGTSDDHHMSGDAAHEILRANAILQLECAERHEGSKAKESFRLDRFVRV